MKVMFSQVSVCPQTGYPNLWSQVLFRGRDGVPQTGARTGVPLLLASTRMGGGGIPASGPRSSFWGGAVRCKDQGPRPGPGQGYRPPPFSLLPTPLLRLP